MITNPQKIAPFLWFDDRAEEAARLYVEIFANGKILDVMRQGTKVLSVTFELEGLRFVALNGGPHFKFTEAVSFLIDCESQEEVDDLWARLIADGGSPSRCGWLKDRFGLSWQVVPRRLMALLSDPDPARAQRAMAAMLQMTKIDVAALERAADGA